MAVPAVQCLSSYCYTIPYKLKCAPLATTPSCFNSLSFSSNVSSNFFSTGYLSMRKTIKPINSIVCEAATQKKPDSAAKRVRQAAKRRMRNRARKSEMRTRMKKVLKALDALKVKKDAVYEEVLPIEKLIGEAYSAIDRAVSKGPLHRNTGARRKSRLGRRKKAVLIHRGWYTPAPAFSSPPPPTPTV